MSETSILSVDHLTMRFGGVVAVNDLSFESERRKITALIGPNGAGKTTVFNCITGFYKPTEGRIALVHGAASAWDGLDALTRRGDRSRRGADGALFLLERMPDYLVAQRAKIARTFQNIRLFDYMSALDNVKLGHHCRMHSKLWDSLFKTPFERSEERKISEHSMELLELVGLENQADNYARNLAYGQQRRLEILERRLSVVGACGNDQRACSGDHPVLHQHGVR